MFRVTLADVVAALVEVDVFFADDAVAPERFDEFRIELRVTGDEPGIEQCGFGGMIRVGETDGLFHRAHGVADFESDVEKHQQDFFDHAGGRRLDGPGVCRVNE